MRAQERSAAITKITDAVVGGCSKEEFQAMRCPVCGSPLMIALHPKKNLFFVRCDMSSIHLSVHHEISTRTDWMDEFVSTGWSS